MFFYLAETDEPRDYTELYGSIDQRNVGYVSYSPGVSLLQQ